jgi:hypothetical protein
MNNLVIKTAVDYLQALVILDYSQSPSILRALLQIITGAR